MDSRIYKSLLCDIKAGMLKKVLSILSTNQLTNEVALNFITCCCNACISAKDNFTAEDLMSTLKLCSQAIHALNGKLLENYLQSLYYIMKYFITQKNPKHVVSLEFLLLPEYILKLNEETNKAMYQQCCKVMHNFIIYLFEDEPRISAEDFLHLCILYFKMCFEVSPVDLIQQKLVTFFRCCSSFGVDILSLYKIYLLILNLLEEKKDDIIWNEDLCQSVFALLTFLILKLNKGRYFCQMKDIIHSTFNIIKSNFKCDATDKAALIISSLMLLIIEEQSYPSKKHVIQIYASAVNKIDSLVKSHGPSPIVKATCMVCHNLIAGILENCESFSPEFWNNIMGDTVQIELYKLTKCISDLFCQVKIRCSCGKCGLEVDFISAYSCSAIGGLFFKNYRHNTSETQLSDKILDKFKANMKNCCEFVAKLKQRNCVNWKSCWNEVGTMLYNTSIDTKKISGKQRIAIKKIFLRYLTQFEGTDDSIILKDILKLSLSYLVNDFLDQKEIDWALVTSALNIYLQPKDRKSLFLKWVHIKSQCKDSNNKNDMLLQQLNLATVFIKYKVFIKSIYPSFQINNAVKIELLKFELEQYKAVWPSKISITSALNELYSLADIVTTVKAFVQIWDISSIYKYIYDLSKQILEKYEKEAETTENKIYLSYLYYIQYNTCKENMRSENLKDMDNVFKITNKKKSDNEQIIPNDECDIVSSYESLKLDKYNEAMSFLHKALDTFQECIGPNEIEIVKEKKIYNLLVAIAFEYRVQCYTLEYLQMCFLCLKVARMTFNKLQIIESIGYIIEKADSQSNSTKALMFETDQLIASLVENDTIEKWETLTLFYISKSIACLLHNDVQMAMFLYKNAKNAYDYCSGNKNRKLLEIRLEYLQWLLFLLPCEYKVEGHYQDSLVKPILTLQAAHEYYTLEGHKSPYFITIFFEIYTTLVHKYIWLRLPRETRCYCKEITFLAQRLLIPLQSVKFLSILAQADLMTGCFDDCLVKIDGMCEILCISKQSRKCLTPESGCSKVEVTKSVELLSDRFEEMMLNIPSSFHQEKAKYGSPVFETERFKLPSFINHYSDCSCYQCMSIDFQEFLLIVLNLYGQLNACQLNFSLSQEYYNNALNVYSHLVSNESKFRERVFHLIHHDVFPTVRMVLLETYVSVLINTGYNVMGTLKFNEINKQIFPLLETIKPINIYLYNEACLQNYMNSIYHKQNTPVKLTELLSPELEKEPENAFLFLTPDSKCSTVNVPPIISPQAKLYKLPAKKIKFVLSDDEINSKDEKKNSVSVPEKCITSELKMTPKTPAPPASDIKVYSRSIIKPRQKKLELNLNCSPSSMDENKQPPKQAHTLEATPALVSPNKNVQKSTKLLTEKLKKAGTGKVPLKQIPDVRLFTCDEGEQGEQKSNSDVEHIQEVKLTRRNQTKQEILQELRRSRRNRTKQEIVATDADVNNKGAIKKTLRN